MRVLLDHNVDWHLVRHLPSDWFVESTRRLRWDDLENGDLLDVAQHEFDVMLTFDKALYGQQNVPSYDIAVIVLRAHTNSLKSTLPFLTNILQMVQVLQPGQVGWLYADDEIRERDRRKRRGEFAR
jgi:hypothetical protein